MNHERDPDDEQQPLLLDPAEEAALARALVSAIRPEPLPIGRHEALIDAALIDPVAEPSEEERSAAEALRRALEGQGEPADAALAKALRAATRQATELEARRATRNALARGLGRPRAVAWAVGASAALSLAAAFALVFSSAVPSEREAAPELAESRSLSPLFAHQAGSSTSERLDRIVAVRSRELRGNRFAGWGVR
jgi:hypothetical protein